MGRDEFHIDLTKSQTTVINDFNIYRDLIVFNTTADVLAEAYEGRTVSGNNNSVFHILNGQLTYDQIKASIIQSGNDCILNITDNSTIIFKNTSKSYFDLVDSFNNEYRKKVLSPFSLAIDLNESLDQNIDHLDRIVLSLYDTAGSIPITVLTTSSDADDIHGQTHFRVQNNVANLTYHLGDEMIPSQR